MMVKILNVDDREVNRYLRSAVLREAGFQVIEAATGTEALERFRSDAPQLVLLDIHLPDMSGQEVCRLIKEHPSTVTAVVLHISAIARDSQNRVSALEAGADGYLAEPVEPSLLVATVRSLLRLRRAEEDLYDSQSRLQLAVEAGNMGLWEADLAARTATGSESMRQMLGFPLDQAAWTFDEWKQRIYSEDREGLFERLENAAKGQGDFEYEFRLQLPEGGMRWILSKGRAVGEGTSRTARITGVAQDVTKRKQVEQDLIRSNDDLNQFAYAASHDLQEPLRTVSSYAQLLARRYEGKLDSDADEYIRFITEGVSRMQRLIQDLLAYSQSDNSQPAAHPIDARGILLFTLSNLQTAITESGATVTHTPMPPVLADPAQLAHVFQNLIGNAIKYRAERPPEIHITGERKNEEVLFSVADNGIGFEPKYAERIFGVFKRLHGREVPGTGIGLALCRRIVQRQGGRIWATSEPGVGSTFYFTLPAARE